MSDGRLALDPDRLPWLTTDQRTASATGPATTSAWSLLLTWGVAALLLVAGGAYWLGRSTDGPDISYTPAPAPARESIALPDPAPVRTAPVVELAPPPPAEAVRPQPAAALPKTVKPKAAKRTPAKSRKAVTARTKATKKKAATGQARARPVARPRPAWPSPPTALYLGRMIQLGTYSSSERLDRAWHYRTRQYPQLQGLPKVTVPYKASNGKIYYRLHVMTTARGQSDWLCRKIRADWRSCSVLRPA